MSGLGWNLGYDVNVTPPKSRPFGRLIAWDPVKAGAGVEAGLCVALEMEAR